MRLAASRRKTSPELYITEIGLPAYRAATSAAKSVRQTQSNWARLIQQSASRTVTGRLMEQAAKRLVQGQRADLTKVQSAMDRMDDGFRELTRMSDVSPTKNPYLKTGWGVLDDSIGGIVGNGLNVIGGPPGTGKTTAMISLIDGFVPLHKRPVAAFTMEMAMEDFKYRALQASRLTNEQQKLVYLSDEELSPDDVRTLSSRLHGVGLIIVDFAELMLDGDQSEAQMASIYKSLAWTGKRLRIPVVLLSQLNRSYDGALPTITMLRYTGMAEAMSSLILLLYNPTQIMITSDADNRLPIVEGHAYIIVGKGRFGFGRAKGPGAIEAAWNSAKGWGRKMIRWHPLGFLGSETGGTDSEKTKTKRRRR